MSITLVTQQPGSFRGNYEQAYISKHTFLNYFHLITFLNRFQRKNIKTHNC